MVQKYCSNYQNINVIKSTVNGRKHALYVIDALYQTRLQHENQHILTNHSNAIDEKRDENTSTHGINNFTGKHKNWNIYQT